MLTYNHENFIEDAIKSIFNQNYQDFFEFFIFDDASTDNTQKIIESVVKKIPNHIIFKYIRHNENIGSVANFNLAMKYIRGELVVVADGDDISLPNRLEMLVDVHQKQKKSLYISNAWLLRAENKTISLKERKFYSDFNLNNLSIDDIYTKKTPIFGASYVFHKVLFDKYPEIDATLVTYNNVDQQIFWRAYLEEGICYLHNPLLIYRIHKQGLSLNKVNDFNQIKKIQYYLNRVGNILCLMQYYPSSAKQKFFKQIRLDFDYLITTIRHMESLKDFRDLDSVQLGYGDKIILNGIHFGRNINDIIKLRLDEFIFVLNKLFLDKKLNEENFFIIYYACKNKQISKREIIVLFYLLGKKSVMPLNLTCYDCVSLILLLFKNNFRVFKLKNRITL